MSTSCSLRSCRPRATLQGGDRRAGSGFAARAQPGAARRVRHRRRRDGDHTGGAQDDAGLDHRSRVLCGRVGGLFSILLESAVELLRRGRVGVACSGGGAGAMDDLLCRRPGPVQRRPARRRGLVDLAWACSPPGGRSSPRRRARGICRDCDFKRENTTWMRRLLLSASFALPVSTCSTVTPALSGRRCCMTVVMRSQGRDASKAPPNQGRRTSLQYSRSAICPEPYRVS